MVVGRDAAVALLGVGLWSACVAEDSVDAVCHERARTPAVLTGNNQPTAVTLELACDAELALTEWSLVVRPGSTGGPSESAVLTADRTRGREFVLTGTFTPRSHLSFDAVEVSATRDDGVRDRLVVVDWSAAP